MAIVDAAGAAIDRWQHTDGKADLLALLDEATDARSRGSASCGPDAGVADRRSYFSLEMSTALGGAVSATG